MTNFAIDVLDTLLTARNDDDRWRITNELVVDLGGSALNFGLIDLHDNTPRWMRSTMSNEWINQYLEGNYFLDDPCLNHLRWSNKATNIISGSIDRGQASSKIAFDLNWGLKDAGYEAFHFIPLSGEENGSKRAFTYCTSNSQKEALTEKNTKKIQIVAAISSAFLSTSDESFRLKDLERIKLSDRERQVLSLLASGLRNDEIAHSIGIAEVTVRLHLSSARKKLGAKTREQAISIAAINGLLNL